MGSIKSWKGISFLYQNDDTRALDERFELDGDPISDNDPRKHELDKCTGYCSLGDSYVERTLSYFVWLARKCGNFIGVREIEIKKIAGSRLSLETSLGYKGSGEGTHLIMKEVEGEQVLFPRNLPKIFL